MGKIKAIETLYRGYRFRSRLEARWAVFFDALGIKWQYEPEGFVKHVEGCPPIRYLPDFYLPNLGVWVEVKPEIDGERASKLAMFLDWGSPLPGFDDCAEGGGQCLGLLLLGPIPEEHDGEVGHTLISHASGLHSSFVSFQRVKNQTIIWAAKSQPGWLIRNPAWLDGFATSDEEAKGFFRFAPAYFDGPLTPAVTVAYTAARQARFEHGQVGAPRSGHGECVLQRDRPLPRAVAAQPDRGRLDRAGRRGRTEHRGCTRSGP